MTRSVIDPITRIEGHLRVEMEVTNGKVSDAWVSGGCFRGMEMVVENRTPEDCCPDRAAHLRRVPHRPCHRRQHRAGKSQRHRGSEQRPRHP